MPRPVKLGGFPWVSSTTGADARISLVTRVPPSLASPLRLGQLANNVGAYFLGPWPCSINVCLSWYLLLVLQGLAHAVGAVASRRVPSSQ